jgi:cation/acetate symporter
MTAGFLGIWLFSVTDRSARARVDKAGFDAQTDEQAEELGQAVRRPLPCP